MQQGNEQKKYWQIRMMRGNSLGPRGNEPINGVPKEYHNFGNVRLDIRERRIRPIILNYTQHVELPYNTANARFIKDNCALCSVAGLMRMRSGDVTEMVRIDCGLTQQLEETAHIFKAYANHFKASFFGGKGFKQEVELQLSGIYLFLQKHAYYRRIDIVSSQEIADLKKYPVGTQYIVYIYGHYNYAEMEANGLWFYDLQTAYAKSPSIVDKDVFPRAAVRADEPVWGVDGRKWSNESSMFHQYTAIVLQTRLY